MNRTKNKQYYYKCWATCALKTYYAFTDMYD